MPQIYMLRFCKPQVFRYICSALNQYSKRVFHLTSLRSGNCTMKIRKINISKNLIIKLAVFAILTAAAVLADAYLDKNPAGLYNIEASTKAQAPSQGEFVVLVQSFSTSAKTLAQKAPERTLHLGAHDKFLQNYHSVRDFQVLKAEVIHQTTPLITSYHYLVFQNHFLSPDEDPLS